MNEGDAPPRVTMAYPAPFLSDEEIAEICAPLRQGAAQIRLLESWGVKVRKKPNGRPLVWRADVEGGGQAPGARGISPRATTEPNWTRRIEPDVTQIPRGRKR